MSIKKIDPAIRRHVKKINSYQGVRTTSSCQGHVRKVDKRILLIDGKIIKIQPAISVMRPFVGLRFTGNRKYWAFLQQVVKKKMAVQILRKLDCKIHLHHHDYEQVFQYNYKKLKRLKKEIKSEMKQVFETVIKALENIC